MNKDTFKNCISAICQEMEANKEYLIALDQQNGDGDLGKSGGASCRERVFKGVWISMVAVSLKKEKQK